MRSRTPTIHCDGDDGECERWSLDYYTQSFYSVDGIRITKSEPVPGWTHVDGDDYCPKHRDGAK